MDKKTKVEVIATAAMVLIFIIILSSSLKAISKKKTPDRSNYVTPQAFQELIKRDAAATENTASSLQAAKERAAIMDDKAPWGKDPFSEKSLGGFGEVAISDLKLEGILCQEGTEPQALINGEVVTKGDRIGNVTVVLIEKDAVIVTDGEKNYKLNLW
jgi:hypothetical protein